jgi:hypothetical protein
MTISTLNGVPLANIDTVNGVPLTNISTINGVAVAAGPVAPTVDAGGPYSGTESTPIQLDGTVTPGTDPTPVILWTIVSGGTGTFLPSASTVDATFTPDAVGPYVLRLSADPNDGTAVTDDANLTSNSSVVADKVGQFPGATGNYFAAPADNVGKPYTGDVTAIVDVTCQFDSTVKYLWSMFDDASGDHRSWGFLTVSSTLRFYAGQTGSTTQFLDVPIANYPDGLRVMFRGRWIKSTNRLSLDHSFDGGATWTELKFLITSWTNLYQACPGVRVGADFAGGQAYVGDIYLGQLFDGADENTGTLLYEWQPDQAPGYGTGQVWNSFNSGETWTGNGTARISAVNTLVVDTFTDTNGVLIQNHDPDIDTAGGGYTKFVGSANGTIQSDYADFSPAEEIRYELETSSADVTVSADLFLSYNGANNRTIPGLVARYTDVNNFWRIQVLANSGSGTQLQLFEIAAGVQSLRASASSAAVANNEYYPSSMVCEGSVITATSGSLSASYNAATSNQTATRHGISGFTDPTPPNGCRLDNFKVTTITDTPI